MFWDLCHRCKKYHIMFNEINQPINMSVSSASGDLAISISFASKNYFVISISSASEITVIPSSFAFVSLLPAFSPATT